MHMRVLNYHKLYYVITVVVKSIFLDKLYMIEKSIFLDKLHHVHTVVRPDLKNAIKSNNKFPSSG